MLGFRPEFTKPIVVSTRRRPSQESMMHERACRRQHQSHTANKNHRGTSRRRSRPAPATTCSAAALPSSTPPHENNPTRSVLPPASAQPTPASGRAKPDEREAPLELQPPPETPLRCFAPEPPRAYSRTPPENHGLHAPLAHQHASTPSAARGRRRAAPPSRARIQVPEPRSGEAAPPKWPKPSPPSSTCHP